MDGTGMPSGAPWKASRRWHGVFEEARREREREEWELIKKLPTQESAYGSADELKKPENEGKREIEVDGRKFELDPWNMDVVEKDGGKVIPFFKLEPEEKRKRREETGFSTELEQEVHEQTMKRREAELERGGSEQ